MTVEKISIRQTQNPKPALLVAPLRFEANGKRNANGRPNDINRHYDAIADFLSDCKVHAVKSEPEVAKTSFERTLDSMKAAGASDAAMDLAADTIARAPWYVIAPKVEPPPYPLRG